MDTHEEQLLGELLLFKLYYFGKLLENCLQTACGLLEDSLYKPKKSLITAEKKLEDSSMNAK